MHCLTNFNPEQEPIYRKAIKIYSEKYNRNILFIDDQAYDVYGNRLNYLKSLNTFYTGNLSEFWEIYDKIKNE